jgi:cell division protein FtsN
MRTFIAVLLGSLIGAVIGGLILTLAVSRWDLIRSGVPGLGRPPDERGIPPDPLSAPPTIPGDSGLVTAPSSNEPGAPGLRYAEAKQLLNAGRPQEAQDAYLALLLVDPVDQEALRGLVAVRRKMAGDDPAKLRRQAAAYEEAIAGGRETEEHYAPQAMEILARATRLAASQVEAEKGISAPAAQVPPAPRAAVQPTPSPTPQPRVTARTARTPKPAATAPQVRRRATPRPTRRPVLTPVLRSPATPPPVTITPTRAAPTPQPSLDVNEPFFLIQIGPISDANRASEIAADLTVAGYAARVSRPGGGSNHFITLGPYRRSVVDTIVKTIRARFGAGLPVAVTPAP